MDMQEKVFEQQPYGKAALNKLKPESENFRLYSCSWEGDEPHRVMKIRGAEFRPAKRGPYKGKLSIMVKDTTRTVYVTQAEIDAERVQ